MKLLGFILGVVVITAFFVLAVLMGWTGPIAVFDTAWVIVGIILLASGIWGISEKAKKDSPSWSWSSALGMTAGGAIMLLFAVVTLM